MSELGTIVNEDFDCEAFYASFPLPVAADPFTAAEVEAQLVERLVQAGYHESTAPVKVRGLLRQLAAAWGVELPPGRTAS